METGGAVMMTVALGWPIIGGGLVGFIGGLIKRHSLLGILVDTALGTVLGFGLTMAFMALSSKLTSTLDLLMVIGLPVVGGLTALWLKGRMALS